MVALESWALMRMGYDSGRVSRMVDWRKAKRWGKGVEPGSCQRVDGSDTLRATCRRRSTLRQPLIT